MKSAILALCLLASPAAAGEVDCLAQAIYHEARGEPVETQIAVGNTILNRVEAMGFPDTVCGVVHQPGQFSWWSGRNPPVTEPAAYKTARSLARKILAGDIERGRRDVFWFYEPGHQSRAIIESSWRYRTIGGLEFRRDKRWN